MKNMYKFLLPLLLTVLFANPVSAVEVISIAKITEGGNFTNLKWALGDSSLYAISGDGAIVRVRTDGVVLSVLHGWEDSVRDFDLSPDGSKLLFETVDGGNNSSLWMMKIDGSNKSRIIDNAKQPVWSLDGSYYCYYSDGIWAVKLDGSFNEKISHGTFKGFVNNDILYADYKNGTYGLYIYSLSNGASTYITDKYMRELYTSNDSKFIYYVFGGAYIYAFDTGSISTISDSVSTIALSNNDEWLAYIVREEDSHSGVTQSSDVWVVNLNGGGSFRVTDTPEVLESEISWSSAGDKLAITTEDGGDIYIVDLQLN